jgi:hypothetical protein
MKLNELKKKDQIIDRNPNQTLSSQDQTDNQLVELNDLRRNPSNTRTKATLKAYNMININRPSLEVFRCKRVCSHKTPQCQISSDLQSMRDHSTVTIYLTLKTAETFIKQYRHRDKIGIKPGQLVTIPAEVLSMQQCLSKLHTSIVPEELLSM